MTPEAQRIAIAEACGWTNLRWRPSSRINKIDRLHGDKGILKDCRVPVYPEDLNAMHKAEKILTYEQLIEYTRQIALVHMQTSNKNDWDFHAFVHIPANERAEAFLKTIGKWKE